MPVKKVRIAFCVRADKENNNGTERHSVEKTTLPDLHQTTDHQQHRLNSRDRQRTDTLGQENDQQGLPEQIGPAKNGGDARDVQLIVVVGGIQPQPEGHVFVAHEQGTATGINHVGHGGDGTHHERQFGAAPGGE